MKPLAVSLTRRKTGEEKIFGSMAQACDWLRRSKTYLKYMVCEGGTCIVKNKDNEEFEARIVGFGTRRDWTEKAEPQAKKRSRPVYYPEQQLCTTCARASGFCIWSQCLEPVPGWEAEPARMQIDGSVNWSVRNCPLYIRDAKTVEGRREQRKQLLEEFDHEKEKRKAGPSEASAAGKGYAIRAAAQAMAKAAERASAESCL